MLAKPRARSKTFSALVLACFTLSCWLLFHSSYPEQYKLKASVTPIVQLLPQSFEPTSDVQTDIVGINKDDALSQAPPRPAEPTVTAGSVVTSTTDGNVNSQTLTRPFASHHGIHLVVASTTNDNTTWINDRVAMFLPDWKPFIYVADDASAPLKPPSTSGREAMVYLTYLIDHWHQLPDIALFIHAGRFAWHNDDPEYDNLALLRRLNLSHVEAEGYANLRCSWTPGCPAELHPVADAGWQDASRSQSRDFLRAFEEIFPNVPVPDDIGSGCCAQFAVTKAQIMQRQLQDYVDMRDWLLHTNSDPMVSGRFFEYMWHIIFGKDAVHCPEPGECYCKLFDLCNLSCKDGNCEGQWVSMPGNILPEGWPYRGLDGQPREFIDQT